MNEPLASARMAGLHYTTDMIPGIRRARRGKGFAYTDARGRPVRKREDLHRIRALNIPPAWKDVWICPISEGHLQATGRDDKGRKQYLYHAQWREVRNETKFNRMVSFGSALPHMAEATERDLALPGLPRKKVLATVVRLLKETLIRVGNKEYEKENNSFGLTTMHDDHIDVSKSRLRFQFRGKGGKAHNVEVDDRRLARIVKCCRDIPGHELFQYIDDGGEPRTIDSSDVNEYLFELTGERFTAKDFRTWGGTVRTAGTLFQMGPPESEAQARKNITEAIKQAAKELGNKPSTTRKYYVHPAILEAYQSGSMTEAFETELEAEAAASPNPLRPEERAVLALLKEYDARNRQAQNDRSVAM